MRARVIALTASIAGLIALLAGPPVGEAQGAHHVWRDTVWIPRNAVSAWVSSTQLVPGPGVFSGYDKLGGRELAAKQLPWLRIAEFYPPTHPGRYMNARRMLGQAYAALGQNDRAASRMLDAARHPNRLGFYGGTQNELDWEQAVYLTYEAHGLDAALAIWREGLEELDRNEALYLEAAIEDGDVFIDETIQTGEAPDWWSRELDFFEHPYSARPRTELVERLLDEDRIVTARELIETIEDDGHLGWPLTLARIRLASIELERSGQSEQAAHLAAMTAPFLTNWANWSDDIVLSLEDDDGIIRTLQFHDRMRHCEPVRRTLDHFHALPRVMIEETDAQDPILLARIWHNLERICFIDSLRASDSAPAACARRDDAWQSISTMTNFERLWSSYVFVPADITPPPEPLTCYSTPTP
ncbi:hypothetical protein [Maricaulis parjimensis]|uniref:hypothetical protein n=1 Tax=Maricaulis parjimensis TaxID=144023 RepID=UPI00193A04BC|nr:hypothetical protein [Maricaulis parjimensis]